MKKSQFTDQQIAFAVQQAEAGVAVEEVCRKLGDQPADVLPLEEEVCRPGRRGGASAEAAGRREQEAQGAGGRPQPRQADPAGCAVKKALKPARRRELVRRGNRQWTATWRCLLLDVSS